MIFRLGIYPRSWLGRTGIRSKLRSNVISHEVLCLSSGSRRRGVESSAGFLDGIRPFAVKELGDGDLKAATD